MAQNTPQPSDNRSTSRKLDDLKDWMQEFYEEETKLEEINALYEWFNEYHKRQFMPNKDALIL